MTDHKPETPAERAMHEESIGTLPTKRWIVEGLRANFFLRTRTGNAVPTPWQMLFLVMLPQVMSLILSRIVFAPTVEFSLIGWLSAQWIILLNLLLTWVFLRWQGSRGSLSFSWIALFTLASLIPYLLATLQLTFTSGEARVRPLWLANFLEEWGDGSFSLLSVWMVCAGINVSRAFLKSRLRVALFIVFGVLCSVVAYSVPRLPFWTFVS